MYNIHSFHVVPKLPKALEYLKELAFNMYWSWDHNSRALFRRLDPELWEKVNRNPVLLLGNIDQSRLEKYAENKSYLAMLERVHEHLDDYISRKSWFEEEYGKGKSFTIAYFSMEFGLAGSFPIYSGGLGILAADHLKSASDLGLPLVGVGILYQQGFFQQYLATDGWQQETYPLNDFYNLPVVLQKDSNNNAITIDIELPGRKVFAQIWRVQVGRNPLYLLDCNIPQNQADDRSITAQLYGGDNEMRIKQEILLGIGGIKALKALNIVPQVCHMNEGHSAFLAMERVKTYMDNYKKATFAEAREATRSGNVFTTHTPVPAGIDEFDLGLVEYYLGAYCNSINLPIQELMRLGTHHQTNGKFNMAIFAINMAGAYNGVSRLHGKVARKMWNYLWPDIPEKEVPIGHVTNGVHVRTWISEDLSELYARYIDPYWYRNPGDESMWERIDHIPDEELWRTHERRRERLVAVARLRLHRQLEKSGASPAAIETADEVLNPEALTIGFARRFAQYKRAYLIFKDKDRLLSILSNKERPVQLIIAGKAHPSDRIGKTILKDIINTIRDSEFRHKIVFIENYDINIASYLVQGVDVWLNNPIRLREASGTSGMKAGANGALNLSILDGWWDEAYELNSNIGWAIGRGEEKYSDSEEQDRIESEELYHILENEVIPLFYKRGQSGIPRDWISMMKTNMKEVCPFFNTNRMVRDYLVYYYYPAVEKWEKIRDNNGLFARELVKWREEINTNWNDIEIVKMESSVDQNIKIGETIQVNVAVKLGKLTPNKVVMQVCYGRVNENGCLEKCNALNMQYVGKKDGRFLFAAEFDAHSSGRHGFTVRLMPNHPLIENPVETGLIKWYNKK